MERIVQEELLKNPKMIDFLKKNSEWIKDLNRNGDNFSKFKSTMKEKEHLRVTDKISDAIDNIDLISSVLEVFK